MLLSFLIKFTFSREEIKEEKPKIPVDDEEEEEESDDSFVVADDDEVDDDTKGENIADEDEEKLKQEEEVRMSLIVLSLFFLSTYCITDIKKQVLFLDLHT